MNRDFFTFNDKVDRYALEPASEGWSFITTKGFRVRVDKFFENLKFPVRFISNLGQAELRRSGVELARFVTNSTIGLLGFFDPATRFGLGKYNEDVGLMFGRWGVPPGPYLVIPLVGPSNPRDGVGFVFDSVLNPLSLLGPVVAVSGAVTSTVNTRAISTPQVVLAREASLDPYIFVRDAFIQRRAAQVANEDFDAFVAVDDLYEVPDDLYELEDDPDEEEPHEVP